MVSVIVLSVVVPLNPGLHTTFMCQRYKSFLSLKAGQNKLVCLSLIRLFRPD
jgi:hypothetical protein